MELFEMIRRGHAAGETIRQLAKKHNVHRAHGTAGIGERDSAGAQEDRAGKRKFDRSRLSSIGF